MTIMLYYDYYTALANKERGKGHKMSLLNISTNAWHSKTHAHNTARRGKLCQ